MRRMAAAKTGEEIGALIQELPERSLEEMSEGERECFLMEQKKEEFLARKAQTARTRDG